MSKLAERAAKSRFDRYGRRPVCDWRRCPVCRSTFSQRTEHSTRCSGCPRFYSDAGWEPVIVLDGPRYGHLEGDRWSRPLLEADFERRGKTMAWVLAPSDAPLSASLLKDYNLIDESAAA